VAIQTRAAGAAKEHVPGARTIGALWRRATSEEREDAAYLVEDEDGGWRAVSWPDAATAVDELANGLLALGVAKGEAFGILARTRLEWALFDFALSLIGAIAAPIYPNSSAKDCAYLLDLSDAVGVLVEDEEQLAKLERFRAESTRLRHVLTCADVEELRRRGRDFAAEHPTALAEAAERVGEDDLFTYIYTSGTTGPPKACMIRHRNYYEMAAAVARIDDFIVSGDILLLYLPLAHNFGRLIHLLGPYMGFTIAFCPDPLRVGELLPQVRPTVLPSVPRVFEKVHTAVVTTFDEASGVKRRLIDWALGVGRRVSGLRQAGRPLPPGLRVQHRLADRLVFSKVKEKLGGRLRLAISGGAPLAQEIAEYFHALDILILEGYGLTECTTACAVNRPSRFRFGTVGPAIPGFELQIAHDGEILIRSATIFAGYHKEAAATQEVITEDGWLRSGDLGELDADGFLRITDRKKDIIVTAGGKNVAPQNLENDLKRSKFVSQALVIGDRRPFLTALVTLEPDELTKWARSRDLDGPPDYLARRVEVRELVQQIIDDVNRDRSSFEQIKRFAILPRDFSAEEDEITPTLKLKRRVCEQHFAAEVEALYRR
jgi:long-chain acyl-CoA synthetase